MASQSNIVSIRKRSNATHQQREMIVLAMESDRELFKPSSNTLDSRLIYKAKWGRLMRSLNLAQGGCKKNISSWQKSWTSLKNKVKAFAAAEKSGQGRCLNQLEQRIARLIDGEFKETGENLNNGYISPASSDDFEDDMDFDDSAPVKTNNPNEIVPHYEIETIELQSINENDANSPQHNVTCENGKKIDETMTLLSNLVKRQTSAIEAQTHAMSKKNSQSIDASINFIGQLLERQTKAIERQTTAIVENKDKQTVPLKPSIDPNLSLQLLVSLLERQTKATEKLTVSVEKQTATMRQFHGMMTKLLENFTLNARR